MADEAPAAILGLTGSEDPQRQNLPDRLTAAVVIGLGGSGIQTVSRVRRAVKSVRPDADAVDGITFVGIDAIGIEGQVPKLPREVTEGLPFLNITTRPFNPRQIVQNQLPTDRELRAWWDPNYEPPAGTITTGMKQQRMLGRMAFHIARHTVLGRISQAVQQATRLREKDIALGLTPGTDLNVYIACSSCGGTGSSGFLEVLHAVWVACREIDANLMPRIRAFLYLPGAFHNELVAGLQAQQAWQQVQANAFAFFRELDHFLVHGDQLHDYVCDTKMAPDPNIGDRDLLYQAYLIDSVVTGEGTIGNISDLYDIAAESMYQFLLSSLAQPITTANAANTDSVLTSSDAYDRRRAYCGLGLSRIVFPGDTYRRYLEMRAADWFLRTAVLNDPPDLDEVVRKHQKVTSTTTQVEALLSRVTEVTYDESVDEFDLRAVSAADALAAEPTLENAEKTIKALEQLAPLAAANIIEVIRAAAMRSAPEVEPQLVGLAHEPGLGVVFADKAVGRLLKAVREFIQSTEAQLNDGMVTKKDAWADVDAGRRALRSLEGRKLVWPGRRQAVAKALGQAIAAWAMGVKQVTVSAEVLAFARLVEERIQAAQAELVLARELFRRLAREAETYWHRDELIGKDSGAKTTTTLVPSDVLPEVECGQIAITVFEAVRKALGNRLLELPDQDGTSPGLRALTDRWLANYGRRGYFSLGAKDQDEVRSSQDALLRSIRQWLHNWVLYDPADNDHPRLPANLLAAADSEKGGAQKLEVAVEGLASLSQAVCWSIDRTRIHLGDGVEPPSPSTVIAAHSSANALVVDKTEALPQTQVAPGVDPERIIALTVEWGVPAHALGAVPAWQTAHDAWMQRRNSWSGKSGSTNPWWPLYLRHEWERKGLTPLVPEYFHRDEVTGVVARALVARSILNKSDGHHEELAEILPVVASRNRPEVILLHRYTRDDGKFAFQGRLLNDVNGVLEPDGNIFELGAGYGELVSRVGARVAYQDSVQLFIRRFTAKVEVTGLVEVISAYQKNLDSVIETTRRTDPDRSVLVDIGEALDDWRDELIRSAGMVDL